MTKKELEDLRELYSQDIPEFDHSWYLKSAYAVIIALLDHIEKKEKT